MGDPLEALLAERTALVESAKDLHARYGAYGTCAEVRENLRAELAVEYRARLADHLALLCQVSSVRFAGSSASGRWR